MPEEREHQEQPRHQPRDATDVRDLLREAAASHRTPFRISAGGSWLDAGRRVAPCAVLDVSALRGIVEYNPGDLTLTAGSGTTLADIDSATAEHGQWLPLDPFGDGRATLGATLATASSGPLAASAGLPRDLALGVEFVDGTGTTVRGGGRVVKNVAGFDLVRLLVGSWGSLGVITEATVRLRARPECDATFALAAPAGAEPLAQLLRAIRDAPLAPLSAELLDHRLARRLNGGDRALVLVRLAGNADSVAAQCSTLESLGDVISIDTSVWTRLRASDPDGAWTLRVSRRPSALAGLWQTAASISAPLDTAGLHATIERGIVRLIAEAPHAPALATITAALVTEGIVVGERLPAECWTVLAAPVDRLSLGVRSAFDRYALLNPGIMGGVA